MTPRTFSLRTCLEAVGVIAIAVSAWNAHGLRRHERSLADAWGEGYCAGRYDESSIQWYPWPPKYPTGQPMLNPYDGSSPTGRPPATYDETDGPDFQGQMAARNYILDKLPGADIVTVEMIEEHERKKAGAP